jgi:hypothetical protein
MRRSINTGLAEYRRGLATLAQIASVAPFVGLVGTVCLLFSAFGISGSVSSVRLIVAERCSESLLPTAAALLAALPALWAYNFFRDRLSAMKLEMETASSEVIGSLCKSKIRSSNAFESCAQSPLLSASVSHGSEVQKWEVPADSQVFFLLPLWVPFFYCLYSLGRGFYYGTQ